MKTPLNVKHKRSSDRPSWSPRRIALAAGLSTAIVGVALGGGWFWLQGQPLPEPTSAQEAMANIGTERFNRMPEMRQQQYMQKAWSLMRDLPPEERRALRNDMGNDDQIREAMQERFHQALVERALAFNNATPEERQRMTQGWPGRGGGGPARGGGGGDRSDGDRARNGSASRTGGGERGGNGGGGQADNNRSRDGGGFRERIEDRIENGNPQTGALMGERFLQRRIERNNN